MEFRVCITVSYNYVALFVIVVVVVGDTFGSNVRYYSLAFQKFDGFSHPIIRVGTFSWNLTFHSKRMPREDQFSELLLEYITYMCNLFIDLWGAFL